MSCAHPERIDKPRELSTAQRLLLLRAAENERVRPLHLGEHSAARVLVRKGWLVQRWDKDQPPGGDRIYWTITRAGRRAACASAATPANG